ncbi:MAG TPA: DUF6295 family protein [Acidimicrobiales bacterium]|nr:DUF6295 family protein [Acidimicrobiales bacterium]
MTMSTEVAGSGKGPEGRWINLTDAHVYFDHPQHSVMNHALIVDFVDTAAGPGARLAVELNTESARRLVGAIEAALAAVEPEVLEDC